MQPTTASSGASVTDSGYLGTDRRKARPDLRVDIRYVRRINVVFDQKPKQARGNLLPLPLVADTAWISGHTSANSSAPARHDIRLPPPNQCLA